VPLCPSRDAAEAELAEILRDEPGWSRELEIVAVDFGGAEPAIRPVDRPPPERANASPTAADSVARS
jgi:hypothetical protein